MFEDASTLLSISAFSASARSTKTFRWTFFAPWFFSWLLLAHLKTWWDPSCWDTSRDVFFQILTRLTNPSLPLTHWLFSHFPTFVLPFNREKSIRAWHLVTTQCIDSIPLLLAEFGCRCWARVSASAHKGKCPHFGGSNSTTKNYFTVSPRAMLSDNPPEWNENSKRNTFQADYSWKVRV